jgi:hypothetical protein
VSCKFKVAKDEIFITTGTDEEQVLKASSAKDAEEWAGVLQAAGQGPSPTSVASVGADAPTPAAAVTNDPPVAVVETPVPVVVEEAPADLSSPAKATIAPAPSPASPAPSPAASLPSPTALSPKEAAAARRAWQLESFGSGSTVADEPKQVAAARRAWQVRSVLYGVCCMVCMQCAVWSVVRCTYVLLLLLLLLLLTAAAAAATAVSSIRRAIYSLRRRWLPQRLLQRLFP